MEYIGLDVHKRDSQVCILGEGGNCRVKTDKRDARTLAEACRLGAYRPAHRISDEQRHMRAQLAVREALVRTRPRYISLVRALVRHEGLRVADGEAPVPPSQ